MALTTFLDSWPKAESLLKTVFGFSSFRPLQEECIRSVLAGRDTVLILPTGGGKSLCYQLPSLIFPHATVVVSPLIALMQDQVNQLSRLGLPVGMLNSSLSWPEYSRTLSEIERGQIKLVFMAPETLWKDTVLSLLQTAQVNCFCIDEAHCISEWGHDFRPEYRRLADLRDLFPESVTLAMTATATPRVRKDILTNLRLQDPQVLIGSFNRNNLFYEVIPKANPFQQLTDFLSLRRTHSGIVYCFSRRQVDDLAARLTAVGFQVLPYHAGLDDETRRRHQELFLRDDVSLMVATIAFGMGIHKPNIRFVVHYDLPRNLESYYQETGRAGRDGLPAHCLLLFGYGDIHKIRYLIDQKSQEEERRVAMNHLNVMVGYTETDVCRRQPLLAYFGETFEGQCGQCDNCLKHNQPRVDATLLAKKFLAVVMRTHQRYGTAYVLDILCGKKTQRVVANEHHECDVFGIGKPLSLAQWRFLVRQFQQKDIIRKTDDQYGVLKLTPLSFAVLKGEHAVWVTPPPEDRPRKKSSARGRSPEEERDGDRDEDLFECLRRLRKQIADRERVPPYIIFSDKTLSEMARIKPRSRSEMAEVFGVGEKKLRRYADAFLSMILQQARKEKKGDAR